MKKNWLRFTCFCILFFFLFLLGDIIMARPNDAWLDFYRIPRNSLDVVYIGNSHSIQVFQPQIINDIVPIKSMTLGIHGENIFISYYELRELLKYQKPKMIVLDTFTINLTDLVNPAVIFQFTDSPSFDGNKLAVLSKYVKLKKISSIFPLFRTSIDWNNTTQIKKNIADRFSWQNHQMNSNLGYVPNPYTVTKASYQNTLDSTEPINNLSLEENLIYLQKIIELCDDNNIQLVLTTLPTIKIVGPEFIFYEPFDAASYARENQIEQLEFDSSIFNELHFSNPDHVNSFGSIDLSLQTTQYLAEEMNFSIDQEKLDYYSTFRFLGYSITMKDDQYVFTLYPAESDAPLMYKYAVRIHDSEVDLFSTDWQKSSEYSFFVPTNKDYDIVVEIMNPQGSYTMNGIFRFSAGKIGNE